MSTINKAGSETASTAVPLNNTLCHGRGRPTGDLAGGVRDECEGWSNPATADHEAAFEVQLNKIIDIEFGGISADHLHFVVENDTGIFEYAIEFDAADFQDAWHSHRRSGHRQEAFHSHRLG